MPADNTHLVIAAARRRAAATRRRAVAALRRLDAAGATLTFDTLAREASVSRSWLYTQPDLRAEVERQRDAHSTSLPERQRCSDASLRQRLELATHRIRELETDNKRVRMALAEALGDNRLVTARAPRHDTPTPTIPGPVHAPSATTSRTPSTTQTRSSED
jgi:phosphoenolpyruvate carboxylase